MRTGFVTCVQLGADVLEEIHDLGGHVDAIVTLHDDIAPQKSGRVLVDALASQHQAALHKTHDVNDLATVQWLDEQRLDWLFIIGWSQIARSSVLSSSKHGVLGMHPTLLPTGRGRASIPWAILKGLNTTGVTLFKLDAGIDTGPIADQVELQLHPRETASNLYRRVADAHRRLIQAAWPKLVAGQLTFTEQDETRASTWPARRPEDGTIRPTMTVAEVDRLVRALTLPYPGARWTDSNRRLWRITWGTHAPTEPGMDIELVDGVYTATCFERLA